MKQLKPKLAIIGGENVGIRYTYAMMIKGAQTLGNRVTKIALKLNQ